MGLDITAYSGLTKAIDPKMEDGYPVDWEHHFHAAKSQVDFSEEHWPGRSEGVERGATYTFAESFGFRAGSYSGYNSWREALAHFAGWHSIRDAWDSAHTSGPFIELINFADNEGIIGPVVAAKLAKDFAEHQEKADQSPDEYWRTLYGHWRKAFEMAADAGAVEFH